MKRSNIPSSAVSLPISLGLHVPGITDMFVVLASQKLYYVPYVMAMTFSEIREICGSF